MATQTNSRLREVAGALALLAGASCTASPSGQAPAVVATRAGKLGVGECETFNANATKQYVSTGEVATRPWCGPDEQLQTSAVFSNYIKKFDQAVQFTIPASIPIAADAGNAGNHHAIFEVRTYTSCEAYTAVTCVFQGGSDQAHPTTADQLAKAAAYNKFDGCYEGFKNVGNRGTKLDEAVPGGVLSGNAATASVLNGGNTCAGEYTQVTLEYQACGGALSGGAPACCDENLIKSGDFEGCGGNNNNVDAIPEWVVTGKVDWWQDSPLDACVVDLAASPGAGKLAQVIPTTVGTQYELLVDVQANQYEGQVPRNIRLAAGATAQDYVTGPTRATLTLPFIATEAQTLIELSTSETGYAGPLIDNVRVRPVVCDQTCDPSITSEPPPTLKLTGTVRDFKFAHADFEDASPWGVDPGVVLPDLGPDGKPVYAGAQDNPTTTGQGNFDQWFNDVPGVNTGVAHAIKFELVSQDPPLYRFDGAQFFPIDGQGFGNEGGHDHNYSFTYELATSFEYRGGETLTVEADDDVWVFINKKLAIDLGGLHPPETRTVNLDEVAQTLGLEIGKSYPLKLFFAERQTGGSTLRIETSIESFSECTTDCNPITDNKKFVWQADKNVEIESPQGYYDVDRDEVAVFSYYIAAGGRVYDRSTGAFKRAEPSPPGLGNIDGAAYDPATKRALFLDQGCTLVEAPTTDLTNTTSVKLSLIGVPSCNGLTIGRDGNLYIASLTDEVFVVSRDGSQLVRQFSIAGLLSVPEPYYESHFDGILSIPGSNNFLIGSSSFYDPAVAIIDGEGKVVVPGANHGTPLSPLTGGGGGYGVDGLIGICSTGHIWACSNLSTNCQDFAPAGGDVNTCPCDDDDEEQCVGEELIKFGNFDGCADQTNPASIPGWTVTGGVDWWWGTKYGNPLLTPQMDGCGVDLVGTPGPGKIAQEIATVSGGKYVLKVDSTPNAVGAPAVKTLRLSAGATTKDYMISGARQTVTLPFTATQAQTLIELTSPDQGNYGPYVDNVSVVRIDCDGGSETCQFPNLPPSDPGLTTIEGFSATVVLDLAKDLPDYADLADVERAVGPYWGKPGEGVLFTASKKTNSAFGGIGKMTQDGAFAGWLVDPATSDKFRRTSYLEYGYDGVLYGCSSNGDARVYKIFPDGTVENVAHLGSCEGLVFGDRGDGVNRLYASTWSGGTVNMIAADGTLTVVKPNLSIPTGVAIPPADSAFQPGLYVINQQAGGTNRIAPNNAVTLDYPYSLGYGWGEVIGFAPPKSAFGDYFYHLSYGQKAVVRVAPNGTWEKVVTGPTLDFYYYTMGAVFSSDGGSYFFTNEDNKIMRLRGCIDGDDGEETDTDTDTGESTGGTEGSDTTGSDDTGDGSTTGDGGSTTGDGGSTTGDDTCVNDVGGELIQNGTFENSCPGKMNNATMIPSWTVTGGVDWWDETGLDGCGVDLLGSPGPGKLSQTIPTVAGGKYRLSVDTIPNLTSSPLVKSLTLSAGATTKDYLVEGARKTVTLEFTATTAQTVIELGSSVGESYGPYVDNVSVVRTDCDDGGVGTPCTVPADCDQMCIIAQGDTTGVCTEPCTAPGDCPAGWSCGELGGQGGEPQDTTGDKCWMFEGLDGGNNNAQIMACGQKGEWGPQGAYWFPYVYQPFVDGKVIWPGWGSTLQAIYSVTTTAQRDAVMAARTGTWVGKCDACVSSAATYCLPPDAGESTGGTTDGDPDAGGGVCLADNECPAAAPECFNVPLSEGKRCGGCENDAQCGDGGCTFPNPYVAKGSYCGGGGAGEGCETDAACEAAAPYCAPVMSKGVLKVRTCSACRTNSDCGPATPNCEPTLDLTTHLRGEMSCVANASLANGATCKNPGKADAACTSGKCAAAKVWNAFPMGVCGQCLSNSDCAQGQTCKPAVLDALNNAVTGSICQ